MLNPWTLVFLLILLWLLWSASLPILKRIAGIRTQVRIQAFCGYATPTALYVQGRVSKFGRTLSNLTAELNALPLVTKFRRNLRRFLSRGMTGVHLEIRFADRRDETGTDDCGNFELELGSRPALEPGLHPYSVHVHRMERRFWSEVAAGSLLVPSKNSGLVIVSDIDDTIVTSHTRNKIRLLLHTFFSSVSDLDPTPGIATLLQNVSSGISGKENNPVFYVSGSPVHLYDKIEAFTRLNGFPVGPILLSPFRADDGGTFFHQGAFKTDRIRNLFRQFPASRFILIGDNGQEDVDLYQQFRAEFPARVALILIYDCVPRLRSKTIPPVGQYRMANALDGALALYRKRLVSKAGVAEVVGALRQSGDLPETFNLEKTLAELDENERDIRRRFRLYTWQEENGGP